MKKRMQIMLIVVGILFGGIFLWKLIGYLFMRHFMAANQAPLVTVSAMRVKYAAWQPNETAVGTLRAIQGVDVTAQLAGMVTKIIFNSGAEVKGGDILVQLNADTDIAQLKALEANAELALITYNRDKAQYAVQAVSKQTVDTDLQNLLSLRAQVQAQSTIVQKKSIRAPFSGRTGIIFIDEGQYINPGDKVVSLQTLDPIYFDFFMPQQTIARLALGQQVEITADTFPDKKFYGKITTINPDVDVGTRNIEVEATIENPQKQLLPGMFAHATILVGKPVQYLTLPQTAVSFNPYGELVYVLRNEDKNKSAQKTRADEKKPLIAKQTFVKTGDVRGDQVAILKGLQADDLVVVAGQLKLKNNTQVAINNTIMPLNNPNPNPPDEH